MDILYFFFFSRLWKLELRWRQKRQEIELIYVNAVSDAAIVYRQISHSTSTFVCNVKVIIATPSLTFSLFFVLFTDRPRTVLDDLFLGAQCFFCLAL